MSLQVAFGIFLVLVAIFGFLLGYWFETRRTPKIRGKKKKNHP